MYVNHAIINIDGELFLLLKKAPDKDSPSLDYYELYRQDKTTRIFDTQKTVCFVVEKTRRKQYAPYTYNTMLLLSWALSTKHLSPKRKRRITVKMLDRYFENMYEDYSNGEIDITTVLAP